ncbi:DEAD/DEAH box helicase [Evansella sp. AB-P1]|uniref:DEAD/DEAH box helicase n=1 Tax=Evansella sp. AB-P1 TaxID=3037653 RepID=UPI00241C1CA0|nr:DEAD/DEAH box helicase [Evansella sp. AB-P1]MDG5789540.1 DEAD/DEAH box helicase [Evansella sp. AB-P1]
MNKLLSETYNKAIEQTKRKVVEDIRHYLGKRDKKPTFESYLLDRGEYIAQIWTNIWINKATNDTSKRDKKEFLFDLGYEVEEIPRKQLNQFFRTEMKHYYPFDVEDWLKKKRKDNVNYWDDLYIKARKEYLDKAEKIKVAEQKGEVKSAILKASSERFLEKQLSYYVQLRWMIAKKVITDIKKEKFHSVDTYKLEEQLVVSGSFSIDEYITLSEFMYELTGSVHKTEYWEYETYGDVYGRIVSNFLLDDITNDIVENLSQHIKNSYLDLFQEELKEEALVEIIDEFLYEQQLLFEELLKEECMEHLLSLTEKVFDVNEHLKIFERDKLDRERIKEEAIIAEERKQKAEERMLEDIFGREYNPPLGRNIHYVLHIGETNTGKTFHALQSMIAAKKAIYLAPLRLLALEVYDKLNQEGIPCSLKTGEEEKEVEGANHVSSTVEMFHEKDYYDVIVIDEAQMIGDKDRGYSWYKAITKANGKEVHIIGSRSVKEMILRLLGDSTVTVHEYSRDIPLKVERKEFNLKQIKRGDALVCFSRRRVLETASTLENNGHRTSMIYGSMPPETRKKQIQRFILGETKVIVSTDAIGMGLNLPIQRIVFLENEKFDGTRRRRLTSQEVKQIAGRAGRKGIFDVGKVAFTKDIKFMKHLLDQDDKSVQTFAIAPTNAIFERFQKYYRDLGTFFDLWDQFESPSGTKKATLTEERQLYEIVRGTEVEHRFSMMDLYGFLHLPFSKNESHLLSQWENTMFAIVRGEELPEPKISTNTLEELELSYRMIGLHLLFLYRLGKGTEALYWERLREEISDGVHEFLRTKVKKLTKQCRRCGKTLQLNFPHSICDQCHFFYDRHPKRYR